MCVACSPRAERQRQEDAGNLLAGQLSQSLSSRFCKRPLLKEQGESDWRRHPTLTSHLYRGTHGHKHPQPICAHTYIPPSPPWNYEFILSLSYIMPATHRDTIACNSFYLFLKWVSLCDLGMYELYFIVPIRMNIIFWVDTFSLGFQIDLGNGNFVFCDQNLYIMAIPALLMKAVENQTRFIYKFIHNVSTFISIFINCACLGWCILTHGHQH